MRKDDGIAVALVDVGHPVSVDLAIVQLPVRFCPDHVYLLICSFPFLWTSGPPKRAYCVLLSLVLLKVPECGCGSGQQLDDVAMPRLIALAVTATSYFISPRVWSDRGKAAVHQYGCTGEVARPRGREENDRL